MKKGWMAAAALCLLGSAAQAQNRNSKDTLLQQLLAEKDSVLLQKQLVKLGSSNKEEDLVSLAGYYYAKRNGPARDSVNKIALKRFPDGYAAMDELLGIIYEEKDPVANEAHFKQMMTRFGTNPKMAKHIFIDYARYYVAVSYRNNPAKVKEYLEKILDTTYKTQAYSYAAREMYSSKQYTLAQELIEKSLSDADRRGDHSSADYYRYAGQYAAILLENKVYPKGLEYAKVAYANSNKKDAFLNDVYLNLLVANNELREAYPMMVESIQAGRATPEVKARLKNAYEQVNGNDAGYATFAKGLQDSLETHIKTKVAQKMVNEPGVDFSLLDTEGKTVRLSDYKGKVVVLDFWATWCAPCKASFPNMQTAVDKYKSDTSVVFLFIHSWETSATPVKDAAAYITANHYTFHVLMDTKTQPDDICKAAAGFKVQGLPTKLIIDKAGNVRFKSMGAAVGANEAFLLEMSAMIELAAKAG